MELRDSIEREAGNSAHWLKHNRLCVAGNKSKLLVIGTNQMRRSKLSEELKIVVDGQEIVETSSEKLLFLGMYFAWRNIKKRIQDTKVLQ